MGRAANGGSHVPHLQRRHGTFHLRVRVPDDLRVRVGLREVRRSLRVHSSAQARPLALKYAARVLELFDMLRTETLTRENVRDLIQGCFHDLAAQVDDGFMPSVMHLDIEKDYQLTLCEDNSTKVVSQLETGTFDYPVTTEAARFLRRSGLRADDLEQARLADIHVGVARALLERDRLFAYRLNERLLPYHPKDPLFTPRAGLSHLSIGTIQDLPQANMGPTLGDALKAYLSQGEPQWTAKTNRSRRRQLGYLEEHLGTDQPLTAITSMDIVSFRDALRRLRVQSKRMQGETFASQQTDVQSAQVSHVTAENLFVSCKAFFAWAKGQQGLIVSNPAADVRFPKSKKMKASKPRRPFNAEELKQLFAAPVFTGMKAPKRRFEPGSFLDKGPYYWLPILGYYTGARLGELVQLHLSDIHLEGPVPYISVTEEGGGEKGSGKEKSVKTEAGVRRVPIHPDLIELGFPAFVAKTAKAKAATQRLFWQVGFGADGQASTVFSKWFARFMDKAGLTDPALVFHSFRHTAEDAFKNALQPQYVIDRIIGHAGGQVSDGYGEGVSLAVMQKAVSTIVLPYDLVGALIKKKCS